MNGEDGLVFAGVLDGKGGVKRLDWAELQSWNPEEGILWVHLDYAHERAQKWLSEQSGLDEIACTSLLAEDTRPRLVSSPGGLLVILRGVNCNPGADPEDMVALRMWLEERRIITMRHRKIMAINDVRKELEMSNGPVSTGDFLVTVAGRITDRMGDVTGNIDDHVDELEDTVLTAETHELRPRLANLRRMSISLRRYIAPQRDVLARLQNERVPWLEEVDRVHLREISERTARFVEDIDSARDRAAITHEELASRLSEQMNKAMYLLSIVAAIFLPLGLLTGLLGINVGGIPGEKNDFAFLAVCVMLLGLAGSLVYVFRRIRWL